MPKSPSSASPLHDVLIVGAGCAGLAAGMYAGRFGLKTAVIGEMPGGTITLTHVVENYPGFVSLTGQQLADNLLNHMKAYNVPLLQEKALSVRAEKQADGSSLFIITTDSGVHKAKSLIAASGTEWKKINVPGEKEYANRGVHYCALCDGSFYKNKTIAIVGSGDSAAKEGLYLADLSRQAYLLVRGPALHGEPINNARVAEHKKLTVFTNTQVKEIIGANGKVSALRLSRPVSASKGAAPSDLLPVDAVFVEIGHSAQTAWLKNSGVALNAKGEILIDRLTRTSVAGLFAAGDCADSIFKQAITGAGEGVTAAYAAYQHVKKEKVG